MTRRTTAPIAIPAWAWKREEARRLLQERDIAGLFRFAQHYSGASQTRLAAATGIAQGRISEILNGRKRVTSFDVIERIADGLGMPDEARILFGLAPLNLAVFRGDSGPATASTVYLSSPSVREEGRVKQHRLTGFIDGIAAVLTRFTAPAAPHVPDFTLEELTKAVRAAKIGYQACRYSAVARKLPILLDQLAGCRGHCYRR